MFDLWKKLYFFEKSKANIFFWTDTWRFIISLRTLDSDLTICVLAGQTLNSLHRAKEKNFLFLRNGFFDRTLLHDLIMFHQYFLWEIEFGWKLCQV